MTRANWMRGRVLPALIVLAAVLSTTPMFFDIYRESAFNTLPRDDYAPALLALVGERGSAPERQRTLLSDAPFGYRSLSVAVGLPFYVVLPYYPFSNLEQPDEPYLRAVAALSMVSYLCILLTVLVIYRIARDRLRCSRGAALLAALLSIGLLQLMGPDDIDPLAALVTSLLVYFIDRPAVFAPLIVASAAVNEKILIIFVIVFAARVGAWLAIRRSPAGFRYWPQAISTAVGVLAYVAMRLVLQLPGGDAHTTPGSWLDQAAGTIVSSVSFKGIILNGIPLVVAAILALVAYQVWRHRRSIAPLSPLDLVVVPALVVIGLLIGAEYTVGRLVLYSFPLYLPLIAVAIDHFLVDRPGGGYVAQHSGEGVEA